MNKLLLALLLCPLMAHAAQWTRIGPAGGGESYIDKGSIIKSDKSWKVWSLVSYPSEQTTQDGTVYRSLKALHLYSCGERTTTLLSQVYYAEPMGKGPVIQSIKYEKFNPEDIVPDSVSDGALQLICKGKKKK